jgi:proteasome lid subunit RPN8/RPN11
LTLPRALYRALVEEARRSLPNECCGLLAGRGREVTRLFPAANALASPTAYEIRPRELFAIFREMRAAKLELVGIYHSHPTGDNAPSARDREQAYYPDAAYVIVSPTPDAPRPVRSFRLLGDDWEECEVEVIG